MPIPLAILGAAILKGAGLTLGRVAVTRVTSHAVRVVTPRVTAFVTSQVQAVHMTGGAGGTILVAIEETGELAGFATRLGKFFGPRNEPKRAAVQAARFRSVVEGLARAPLPYARPRSLLSLTEGRAERLTLSDPHGEAPIGFTEWKWNGHTRLVPYATVEHEGGYTLLLLHGPGSRFVSASDLRDPDTNADDVQYTDLRQVPAPARALIVHLRSTMGCFFKPTPIVNEEW